MAAPCATSYSPATNKEPPESHFRRESRAASVDLQVVHASITHAGLSLTDGNPHVNSPATSHSDVISATHKHHMEGYP